MNDAGIAVETGVDGVWVDPILAFALTQSNPTLPQKHRHGHIVLSSETLPW